MFRVEDDGAGNWKVMVNPDVMVENVVDWNSSTSGKSGYKAALGYDARPPAGTKLVYLLFPQSEWDKSELESEAYQLHLNKMARKCNVCATMDALRSEAAVPTQTKQVAYAETPQVAAVPAARQMSAGDIVGPLWIPKVANVGKQLFCTQLGNVATSVIGSVIFDIMSGWASDPGQKEAMRQISNQLVDMDIKPEDMPAIRQDALTMYDAWRDGGIGEAVRTGMFKKFDDAIKDGIGVEMNTTKTTTTRRKVGIRKGIAGTLPGVE